MTSITRKAQFILYNKYRDVEKPNPAGGPPIKTQEGFRARPLPYEDETYYPEEDENGFSVFTAPEGLAKLMCSQHSDRFRLYKTRALDCQYFDTSGAARWVKLYPWTYRKITKAKEVDNPEAGYVTLFEWKEDKACASAVNHDAAPAAQGFAPAPAAVPLGEQDAKMSLFSRHVEKEFDRIGARIENAVKSIEALASKIENVAEAAASANNQIAALRDEMDVLNLPETEEKNPGKQDKQDKPK